MDTDLVKRAHHGNREAYGLIAADIATRFLAISRRILRDLDLAEDATQQALVAIWRDLPQLRDPARFDAWSYRLLVRACYAEGRAGATTWRYGPHARATRGRDDPDRQRPRRGLGHSPTPASVLRELIPTGRQNEPIGRRRDSSN